MKIDKNIIKKIINDPDCVYLTDNDGVENFFASIELNNYMVQVKRVDDITYTVIGMVSLSKTELIALLSIQDMTNELIYRKSVKLK